MQQILPLIPSGATRINEILSCVHEDGYVHYYLCAVRIGFHREDDLPSFKYRICELISTGVCRNRDILSVLDVTVTSLKRWLREFKEEGPEFFYRERGTRGGAVLTDPVLLQAQLLLDQGFSRAEVAEKLSVSYDVIRKAVKDGRLHVSPCAEKSGSTRTERNVKDADCGLGVACVRSTERILAAAGVIKGARTEFEENCDIEKGGVLCALPALVENGLYRHLDGRFQLPEGYYDMIHVVSLLSFMVLFGVPIIERLRFESPGEMGKLLGLDRIPEVKTLRNKLSLMCADAEAVAEWTRQLSRDWFNARPDLAGILYVDGHVSVYHGDKTPLPRRYCARMRLCMRGSTFYYVNDVLGQPFFAVEQVVDEGLLKTLRNIIIPRLLFEVPGQPSLQELEKDPRLYRFMIIFDREGYSPDFFREMWVEHRIACMTYHKYPGKPWPEGEFVEVEAVGIDGASETMRLAERGVRLGETDGGIWMKEIRRLTKSGHQTSIITTALALDRVKTAIYMFNRWVQENFFKYMVYLYCLDSLIEKGTEVFSGPARVVNPSWKDLDYKVNSITQKLHHRLSKFGKTELPSNLDDEDSDEKIKEKSELLEEIEQFQFELEKLKAERKKHPKHIDFDELPENLKFERLKPSKRLFFDTVKMLVYRAETAMANTVRQFLDRDDARVLIRQLMKSHADIIPDTEGKILNVRIHRFTTRRHDRAVGDLLATLNETETPYPGTDMKLVYSLTG